MSQNPDDTYWAKAATEPLSPASLWIYPELKRVDAAEQRAILKAAKRLAEKHWLSQTLRFLGLAIMVVGFWTQVDDHTEYHRALFYSLVLASLAWFVCLLVRTKLEVRTSVSMAGKD